MNPNNQFDRPLPVLAFAGVCLYLALIAAGIFVPVPSPVVEAVAPQPAAVEAAP